MADTIQLRAGNKAGMPELLDRELAYVKDEEALYVGTPNGNKKMGKKLEDALEAAKEESNTKFEALENTIGGMQREKLSASKTASLPELAADVGLAEVVDAFNALVASMKDSGLMET